MALSNQIFIVLVAMSFCVTAVGSMMVLRFGDDKAFFNQFVAFFAGSVLQGILAVTVMVITIHQPESMPGGAKVAVGLVLAIAPAILVHDMFHLRIRHHGTNQHNQ